MITVKIERSHAGHIRRFTVSGHAGFDDPGKDIVCAGVSAVTVGAVNAVEKLTGLVPKAEMRGGWLCAELPDDGGSEREKQAQLLLEGMIVSLETIADAYGAYVQIQEHFSS
jgi:hypothetical protein